MDGSDSLRLERHLIDGGMFVVAKEPLGELNKPALLNACGDAAHIALDLRGVTSASLAGVDALLELATVVDRAQSWPHHRSRTGGHRRREPLPRPSHERQADRELTAPRAFRTKVLARGG